MPINLSFQPAAAAVGGLALLGGQGQFVQNRNQLNLQYWQAFTNAALQAQQMQQTKALALAQMQNQNQQQAQQQFFDAQKIPQQAALENQQQVLQYGLQGQNQQDLAQLQGQIHSDQSSQQFDQQQQLLAAQQQGQLGNQMEMARYNQQLQQQAPVDQLFANPLQQHMQNVANANGYTFTPQQQEQVDKLKGQIQGIQNAVGDGKTGSVSKGTAFPALQTAVAQLNNIKPSQPPPTPIADRVSQSVTFGYKDPATGQIKPGTENTPFTIDPKTGETQVVRGWKPAEAGEVNPDTGEFESEKARGQRLGNQIKERKVNLDRTDWVEKHVQTIMKNPFAGVDMQTGARDPNFENNLRAFYGQQYDQAAANTPSGVAPVGSATPPGQSPTGQPTGAPAGGQGAAGPPQQQPQLPPVREIQTPEEASQYLGWIQQQGIVTPQQIQQLPPPYIAMLARAKAIMEQHQPHRINGHATAAPPAAPLAPGFNRVSSQMTPEMMARAREQNLAFLGG